MNREELLDKIEAIQNTSIGQSQTNKIADLIEQEKKAEVMDFLKWWVKGTVFKNIDKQELYQQFKEATK
jgi:ferritin